MEPSRSPSCSREAAMADEADQTRRWLLNTSGAAMLSSAIPAAPSHAQSAAGSPTAAGEGTSPVSHATSLLADHVAGTLDRDLPAEVVARSKLHVLDTLAAIVSGSPPQPRETSARYAHSLGGRPQGMVVGTRIVTATVPSAVADAHATAADET